MAASGTIINAILEFQKTTNFCDDFCQSFSSVPPKLKRLLQHFQLLAVELELLLQLVRQGRSSLDTPSDNVQLISHYIQDAADHLFKIESSLREEAQNLAVFVRPPWNAFANEKLDFLLCRVADVESLLVLVKELTSEARRSNRAPIDGLDCPFLATNTQGAGQTQSFTSIDSTQAPSSRLLIASNEDANCCPNEQETTRTSSNGDTRSFLSIPYSIWDDESSSVRCRDDVASQSLIELRLRNCVLNHSFLSKTELSRRVVRYEEPILAAARLGNSDAVLQILQEDPQAKFYATIDGETPVGVAIAHGQYSMVKLLLDEGLDIDATFGRFNTTALGQALRCRQYAITKLLIGRGASFSSRNKLGWTPIYSLWANKKNQPAIKFLRLLQERPDFDLLHKDVYDSDGWSVICRASCFGTAEDLKLILSYGLNPLDRVRTVDIPTGHENWSLLHMTCWYGAFASVKLLAPFYTRGPGIDVENDDGVTPLQIAVDRKHIQIAFVLLDHGASPTKQARCCWIEHDHGNHSGHTAMSLAAHAGYHFERPFRDFVKKKRRAAVKMCLRFESVSQPMQPIPCTNPAQRLLQHQLHQITEVGTVFRRRSSADVVSQPQSDQRGHVFGNSLINGRAHLGDYNLNVSQTFTIANTSFPTGLEVLQSYPTLRGRCPARKTCFWWIVIVVIGFMITRRIDYR